MRKLAGLLTTGSRRDLSGPLGSFVVKPLGAVVALGIVYTTTIRIVDLFAMTIVFLGMMLAMVFLSTGATEDSDRQRLPVGDLLLAVASLATSAYFLYHNERIITRITLLDELTRWDVVCGTSLLLITIEATRRTVGLGITSVVLVFLAYNLWGDHIPGMLGHGVIDYEHFLDIMVFTTDGIFGVPVRVALTYVFLFGLFGTFLSRTGGGDFFFDLAAAVSGRRPGGAAKIAVTSSGLYGTISGSPTADVVTTGSITIPMMKRLGYSGALAGGIEVAASTGGSILPPVMGSAAFIMAEFTGIPYAKIALAAIVPALLYYACVYLQVHLRSLKLGLAGLDESRIPKLGVTLKQGGLFAVPLLALVIALLLGYSPVYVAVAGTLALLAVAMLRKSTRLGVLGIYETLAESSMRVVPVVAACAAAGMVVAGLSMTGFGAKVVGLIFLIAGEHLFPAMLVAALIAILLGMGMPTPSVYIIVAVLVAPALTQLGATTMGANLFLVYFASLSAMTPPVAVASFAAAPIADANPIAISVNAVRVAITAFVIPFSFVFSGDLLLDGVWWRVVIGCVAAAAAVVFLCAGAEGYWRREIAWGKRLVLIVAGFGLLTPWNGVRIAALAFGAVVLFASLRPGREGTLEATLPRRP
ncbi:MAG: TRAP transporter fused permease subunit [Burkholderiales bacterium]|nr:TRAP transporter fused permease subunit [Burkholderiales bacterium]